MKKTLIDLSWLPAQESWDFRGVKVAECRIACHWEYSREVESDLPAKPEKITDEENGPIGPENTGTFPVIDLLVSKGAPFPKAWTAMTDDERQKLVAAIPRLSSLDVRSLEKVMDEKVKRAEGKLAKSLRWGNEGAYVIRPGFTAFGVEAVVKEFAAWARKEAKEYDRSLRAKAAEPPFDLLKWLAVRRLEAARRKARISYEQARQGLQEFRMQRPCKDENGVFPIYASHGAWCKASSDAEKFIFQFVDDPFILLGKVYAVF